ncbi:hypothetical protein [Burkholderia multivorans]|uniref:hypothetical protein n=1 Tax=Burkholderia multivorans TaxID=87883 RepID=UPI0009E0D052|nr:hypothetical protein [Burkholderia multivorans]SAJ97249.1 hypothetical protein UA12_05642 [Burkholderia multivorans]
MSYLDDGQARDIWVGAGYPAELVFRYNSGGAFVRPIFAKGRLARPFAFLTRPSRRVFYWPKQMKKID